MLTVYYSPHMTSSDNLAGRASGHADVPLTDEGIARARELRQHYRATEPIAVYRSDLQRARHTAEIVFSGREVPIVADARLREVNYGAMTQAPVAEVDAEFSRRVEVPFPDGESVRMVVERVGALLREAVAAHDEQTVVIIGHRGQKLALEYWSTRRSLADIVPAPWPWRDVPIYRYELRAADVAPRPPER